MNVRRQITGMKENHPEVMRYIYTTSFPGVESFILRNNGSSEDAKDIFQEAFITAWRNITLDRFEPGGETALSGYIFRIAKNKWLDHLRSARFKTTVSMPDIDKGSTIGETLTADELDYVEQVEKHFRSLGDPCHELLKRFYFQKEKLKDIASFFSWTEATAKNNKYRCLERLRNLVLKK